MASAKKKASRKKAAKKAPKKTAKRTVRPQKKAAARKTAKKTARKAAAPQKPAARPVRLQSTSRERVYNLTKEIPEHHFFILANGQPVKHVAELAAILDQLEDEVFNHHIRPESNDYANWIQHIFEDLELARKVAGVDEKKRLQLVIYKHLAGHE